ncbi:flagellar basal body rod protein FlgC [Shimia marina]|uniref:Putative proximal rod protein n=1 Tax=Shimia marina TaxID=321267 RepID=A0A0P1ELR8_9RHOB|nr:flagellar basal body rod protein FlgC [Shimia marina]CUH51365.1 Putative proximal rod protein [Shimia marina]SFD50936.1 flagellar basal-body rod protein FlgC [Shimia marina]
MSDLGSALSITSSGLRAQAARLRHVSENIANADTPGYQRKTVRFEADTGARDGSVMVGPVQLDRSEGTKVFDPSHPMADATGNYFSSNVDMIIEIADAREAQRSYEANLKMFDQTRQMSSSLMELLRK